MVKISYIHFELATHQKILFNPVSVEFSLHWSTCLNLLFYHCTSSFSVDDIPLCQFKIAYLDRNSTPSADPCGQQCTSRSSEISFLQFLHHMKYLGRTYKRPFMWRGICRGSLECHLFVYCVLWFIPRNLLGSFAVLWGFTCHRNVKKKEVEHSFVMYPKKGPGKNASIM